jgi:hypothetical protein
MRRLETGLEVVLHEKPFPVERFAAHEMTNFLSRVLGAPVPIVENGGAACAARILLGRAAGFDVSTLERDAFRIKAERLSKLSGMPDEAAIDSHDFH